MTAVTKRGRAFLAWAVVAVVGLAFLVGPIFTHHELSGSHVLAHLVTGPYIVFLAGWQILAARRGRARRWVDGLLVLGGLWLAVLPFAVPAPGLHVHAHIAAGAVVALAAAYSALRPPRPSLPPKEIDHGSNV